MPPHQTRREGRAAGTRTKVQGSKEGDGGGWGEQRVKPKRHNASTVVRQRQEQQQWQSTGDRDDDVTNRTSPSGQTYDQSVIAEAAAERYTFGGDNKKSGRCRAEVVADAGK